MNRVSLVSSALITGLVLCLTGLITVLIALFLVPLIANQLCYLQPTVGLPLSDDLPRGGEECTGVFTTGLGSSLSSRSLEHYCS